MSLKDIGTWFSLVSIVPMIQVYFTNVQMLGGRGFIKHPEVSPQPHGLAVYHQLHCLVSGNQIDPISSSVLIVVRTPYVMGTGQLQMAWSQATIQTLDTFATALIICASP